MQLAGVQGPLSVLRLTLATTGRAELGAPCKVAGTPFLLPCPSSTFTDKVSIAPDGEESGPIIEVVKGGMEHTGSQSVTVLLAVHRTPFPFSQCHSCRGPLPGPEPSFSTGLSPGRAAWGLQWELSVRLHYRHGNQGCSPGEGPDIRHAHASETSSGSVDPNPPLRLCQPLESTLGCVAVRFCGLFP